MAPSSRKRRLSRQRIWQLEKMAQGICCQCGTQPRHRYRNWHGKDCYSVFCEGCLVKARLRYRPISGKRYMVRPTIDSTDQSL